METDKTDKPEEKSYPESYVKELRSENAKLRTRQSAEKRFSKGYLPSGVTIDNSDASFYLNKFPMGDADNFSISRICYAMLESKRRFGRKWEAQTLKKYAPWEYGYLDAMAQVNFKVPDGVEVETKAQGDQVSGLDGGFLAPELWSNHYFQILSSIAALDRLPVTRFNVPLRVLKIPKTALDVTVSYPGENTAPTATQYSFGQVEYTARKASVLINASIELMRDSPLFQDQLLREEGARSIAVDRDKQAFTGVGGNTPTGLIQMSVSGSGPVGSFTMAGDAGNGATPAYADYLGARYQCEHLSGNSNVTAGRVKCDGVVANIRLTKTIQSVLDTSTRPIWPYHLEAGASPLDLGPSNMVADNNAGNTKYLTGIGGFIGIPNWKMVADSVIPINVTKGSSNDTSYMIFGSWAQFVLFDCLALGFDITEEGQGMQNAQAQIRLIHRWDCGPAHPEAFVVVPGVRG